MRKATIPVYLFIMSVVLLGCSDQDSVLDVLSETGGYEAIFHHEEVENGVIVFYEPAIEGGAHIAATFIQKTSSGWKGTIDRGGHSIDPNIFTTSQMLFQSNGKSPFPILFGEVINQNVEKVRIKLGKTEMDPQSIHTQGHHIWYVLIDESAKDSMFIIEGLSKNDKVIDTIEQIEGQSSSTSNQED